MWERWRVEPLGLRELLEAVGRGVRAAHLLHAATTACSASASCRSASRTRCSSASRIRALFDEAALADALTSGRMAAAWLDSLEPGALDPGRPLHGIDDAADHAARGEHHARVAQLRSAWAVAKRIDELLKRHARRQRASSGRRRQASRLILQPAQRRREVGQALLLLIDHRGRRARDEALVAQAWPSPWRSRPAGARSPCSRRSRSAATSISTCSASARVALPPPPARPGARLERRFVVEDLHFAQPGQRLQHRRGLARRMLRRRSRSSGTRSRGRQVHLAAQVAARADQRLQRADPGIGLRVDPLELRLADTARVTMRCARPAGLATGDRRDALPQLGGDERRDRVQQAQHRLEHADQRAARRALLRVVAAWRSAPSRSRGTSRSTRPTRTGRSRWRRCRAGTRRSPARPRLRRAAARS